ncbi:hypothetical protein DPMN_110729 [Dreissena polymorpha]|uniref:SH2 domain-containing protein n=1 Tax=Dreissena polymorpha TaxID=45954 RepID=A0A9D4QNB0_DREPO|nr:hypothetical protein DPMN_110729 [Dreissena polymorpha]
MGQVPHKFPMDATSPYPGYFEHIPKWHKKRTSGGFRRRSDQSSLNPSKGIYDEMGQENSAVYMEFEQDGSHSSHASFDPHVRSGVDMIDGAGLVGQGPSTDESSVYSYAADPDVGIAEVQRRHPKTQRSVSLDEEYSQPPDTVPLPKGTAGSQDYQEPYHSKGLVREPVPQPGSIYLLARDVPPKQSADPAIDQYNRLNDLSNDFRGVRLNSQDSQESYDHLWSSKANPATGSVQKAQAANSKAPKTNSKAPGNFISTRVAQMEHDMKDNPPGSYEEPWDSEEGRKKFESVIKKAEKTHERRVSNTNDSSTNPQIQKTITNPTNPTPAVSQASNGNIYGLAWSSPLQKPDPAPSLSASNVSRNPTIQQQRKPTEAGAANYEDAWDLPEKQRELEEKLLKAGLPKKSSIQLKPDTLQREADSFKRDYIHEDISMFSKRPSLTSANQASVMPPSPMRRSHPQETTNREHSCRSLGAFAEKIDRDLPLEEQNFYHGLLKRTDAERMLTVFKEGSYLVRRSEANKNDYSLTLKGHGNIPMHMKITSRPDGMYVLGENSPPFNTIPLMVDYYTCHPLPVQNAERICLLYPIPS